MIINTHMHTYTHTYCWHMHTYVRLAMQNSVALSRCSVSRGVAVVASVVAASAASAAAVYLPQEFPMKTTLTSDPRTFSSSPKNQ